MRIDFVSCVALGKLPHLSGSLVLHLKKRILILACLPLGMVLIVIKNDECREDSGKIVE